ncbi:DASH family cryptochrome [Haloferax sp. MBLA0076]|uniref:Cryptochrome DASH n=1 Tax=Haloferax litoreum TaxID=2666140 RepID=A0A6A8GLF5_9EURY|nr:MULTISPECIES: DASH family cryptochrome [Haloferax]KAB1193964.1 DASH family cryptochrome [Haloferax sp. CBA1148]MRX22510.1 DASH family cryptochrome [Haloferax litoreum]
MPASTALVWFRRDLRLHDNDALAAACEADHVVPVYCFDPRDYGPCDFGGTDSFVFRKTGAHRARFRLESVADLRSSLRDRGSELVVRVGHPESVLSSVADAVDADVVTMHTWPTAEERQVEAAVTKTLDEAGVGSRQFWGHTLTHVDDLPMGLADVPDTYTTFRKAVEAESKIRTPSPIPELPPLPADAPIAGDIPTVSDLDSTLSPPTHDDRGVLPFDGGETAALDRVESYIWEGDHLRAYKETRNGMLGSDYSSKFSPWLNEGCLSPRYVQSEVDRYEVRRVKNDSTYWLTFELQWRDFFQFQFAKHGSEFFQRGGIRHRTDIDWRVDDAQFERWASGQTGIPFVDANMRELNATGYVSNRGRQNVASFLANNLRLDWRRGAAYFETHLVDYDPASNYGNWAYIAGVGNDSRDRYFNLVKQARQYDGDAAYVKHWIPELAALPPNYAHEPWTMTPAEQAEYGVELGDDYPEPMIHLEKSYEKLR